MGYLRFYLMLAVIIEHFIYNGEQGRLAVFGFYALSGFLITLVSCEIYGGTPRGKLYFLSNRFLRIYPTYWACLIVGIACIYLTQDTLKLLRPWIFLPPTWQAWTPNLTVFGLVHFPYGLYTPRPLSEAWTLAVELTYYLIIGLVTGRRKMLTFIALVSSVAMVLWLIIKYQFSFDMLYNSIEGPAPVFFAGSLLYHCRHIISRYRTANPRRLLWIVTLTLYLPGLTLLTLNNACLTFIAYISVLPTGYCIACFYYLSLEKSFPPHEQWLADLSYPMFLLHRSVIGLVCYYMLGYYRTGLDVFFAGFIATFIVSAGIVWGVERPLKRVRRYFRGRGSSTI